MADATVDFELRRFLGLMSGMACKTFILGFLSFWMICNLSAMCLGFVVEASRGKLLPFYLRLFAPLIIRIYYRGFE